MAIYVSIINGMGSGEDGNGDPLQNIIGAADSDFMNFPNVFLKGAGVADKFAGNLAVAENGTPDDTVDVAIGGVYIENSNGQMNTKNTRFWYLYSDAIENLEIAGNSSGNPRIDLIVATVDPVNPPGDEGELAGSLQVIQGTPDPVPVAPAVPADSYALAQIAVANSFTTITNANITDLRNQAIIDERKVENNGGWRRVTENWTYSSVDNPTGVVTVPSGATSRFSAGMKIRLVNNSNTIHGFITAVTSTTITFLHQINPANNQAVNLLTNNPITDIYFSTEKAPLNFPMTPLSWSIVLTDTTLRSQSSPSNNVWYSPGGLSIVMPIGLWDIYANACATANGNAPGDRAIFFALSTANNSSTVARLKVHEYSYLLTVLRSSFTIYDKGRTAASKTTWYPVISGSSGNSLLKFENDQQQMNIVFTLSYL